MSRQVVVYVGTYTERIVFGTGEVYQGKGRGIYRFGLDPDTGRLEPRGLTPEVMNPSFLTLDPRGRFALVSNYTSGSLSVLPIGRDGALGQAVDFVQHNGQGADRVRQSGPHVHSVTLADEERLALVADLGLDRLMVYRFDSARGRLKTVGRPWLTVQGGAGPRHLALHPDGRHAYLANELDSTVVTLEYGRGGSLRLLDAQPTLPSGFTGHNTAADIHLTADGRFLYASNRGDDSIVAFAVEPGTGKLKFLGHEPTQGRTPRNFAIDPSGGFLLAANQDSDTVVSFRIDPQTGRLRPAGQVLEVPTPVCVLPAAL